jgi:DNA repair exonuclease SbcCD ATPase subunit
MQRFVRPVTGLVILVVVLGLTLIDANAQTRRKRRSRRVTRVTRPVITNPTITPDGQAATDETKVLSTADDPTAESTPVDTTKSTRKKKPAAGEEDMQQTINALSNQVNRLNDKLTQMQSNERSLLDMERLTRAEQRSESLRAQQLETESKLADFHAQLDQVEYSLKPENIERAMAGYGTTRPEEAREARRRQLESEKARLQVQIRILETSRTRLETAVANADAEVDMLRRRLQQTDPAPVVMDSQPARSEKP